MTETRRTPAAPSSDLGWPMPWMAFGAASSALEPVARNTARFNLELSSLVGQRAQAYSRIPETLAQCRTPAEVLQAQMAFWQEAGRQYAATAEHLAQMWRSVSPMPFGATAADAPGEARDFITFPEAKSDTQTDERRQPGGGRRAA